MNRRLALAAMTGAVALPLLGKPPAPADENDLVIRDETTGVHHVYHFRDMMTGEQDAACRQLLDGKSAGLERLDPEKFGWSVAFLVDDREVHNVHLFLKGPSHLLHRPTHSNVTLLFLGMALHGLRFRDLRASAMTAYYDTHFPLKPLFTLVRFSSG
jgi:hypothetical protein